MFPDHPNFVAWLDVMRLHLEKHPLPWLAIDWEDLVRAGGEDFFWKDIRWLLEGWNDPTRTKTVTLELGYDKTRVPDLSIFSPRTVDFRHDEVKVSDPPQTVVEIFSPQQASQEVMAKLDEHLAFGVKSVWVVSPPLRQVTIFAADGREARFTEGIATDPVTGLTADLNKVFRPLSA